MSDNIHLLKEKLYQIIVALDDEKTVEDFLKDLCTNKEIEQMAQRIKAAELIKEGKTYCFVTGEVADRILEELEKHGYSYDKQPTGYKIMW